MNERRDDKLTAAARQLATEIRPQRDLWPDIERAIAAPEPRRSRWTPMFAQAAAIVLLVGASSGLTYLAVKDDRPVVITQPTPEYTFERASFGSSYSLGRDYLETRADVVARFEQQVERLSPAEREGVERSRGPHVKCHQAKLRSQPGPDGVGVLAKFEGPRPRAPAVPA